MISPSPVPRAATLAAVLVTALALVLVRPAPASAEEAATTSLPDVRLPLVAAAFGDDVTGVSSIEVRRGTTATPSTLLIVPRAKAAAALAASGGAPAPAPWPGTAVEPISFRGLPAPGVTGCQGVTVRPGDPVEELVGGQPTGTTFCFAPGVHRVADAITPHDRMTFVGAPGAVLRGSEVLTGWHAVAGGTWAVGGQSRRFPAHGECETGTDASCRHGESLFRDGVGLREVSSRARVVPGTFFLDEGSGEMVIADDPGGHLLESSVAWHAFVGRQPDWSPADDVTVRGLVIEQFGGMAQRGAIDTDGGSGWLIEGNEVRSNHGVGICAGTGSTVRGNAVHHNGQLGLCGTGQGLVVEGNDIHHNNTGGFAVGWEGGGSKWARTTGLVVRGNSSHDNNGFGFWTDIDNAGVRYEGNLVERNTHGGIFHEISYAATIVGNTIRDNGAGFQTWGYGGGIVIAHSAGVEIRGNLVEGNYNAISLLQQARGDHRLEHVVVEGNTISGGHTGIWQDVGDRSVFTDRDLVFRGNLYRDAGPGRFAVDDAPDRTWEQWRATGQDVASVRQ